MLFHLLFHRDSRAVCRLVVCTLLIGALSLLTPASAWAGLQRQGLQMRQEWHMWQMRQEWQEEQEKPEEAGCMEDSEAKEWREFDDEAIISALSRRNSAGLGRKEKEAYEVFLKLVDAFKKAVVSGQDEEYEAERQIWKFMQDNYEYIQSPQEPEEETPYGLAVEKRGTAKAFARAFRILAGAMGLETYYIEGTLTATGEAWAWNQVRLNGKWYQIDTALGAREGSTAYMNLTNEMMAGTHGWSEENYPACVSTQYHYANAQILEYLKNGKICSAEEEARAYIEENIASSAKQFYVLAPEALLSGEVLTAAASEYGSAVTRQIVLLDGTEYTVVKLSPYYNSAKRVGSAGV